MDFVPLANIIVPPKRVRRKFDVQAANELADSVSRQGLFTPLLVRDDGVTLIAGERRLRCLDQLFATRHVVLFDGKELDGVVPVVRLHDADALAILEAELSENTRRQQLTWQEQAAATEAIHQLHIAKNPAQTRDKTAETLDRASDGVRADILVAGWLGDEEIASAASRTEALKIIERKLEKDHRASLAQSFSGVTDDITILNTTVQLAADRGLPPSDLIIADPPYGVNADTWDNQSAVPHSYEDTLELSNSLYTFIANSIPLKPQAHAFVFCDPRRFSAICGLFRAAGWRVWDYPLVWNRGSSVGLLPWPEHGPRRTYEVLLYAIKGDRRTTGVFPDVINVPHDSTHERGAHKPSALYADLIRRSCLPGDRVIDPCAGTGPLVTAARLCHVRATLIEPDLDAFNQAKLRLTDDSKVEPDDLTDILP